MRMCISNCVDPKRPKRETLGNQRKAEAPTTASPQRATTSETPGASSTTDGTPKTNFSTRLPHWLTPNGEPGHEVPLVEPSTQVDRVVSARLADRIQAQPNECYRNAALALFSSLVPADSWYVEGTVAMLDVSLPLEHGWIELRDKTILDPTLFRERSPAPQAGEAPVFLYYGGIRYSRDRIIAAVHSLTGFPLIAHEPTPWFTHDGYRNAYQAALARVLSQRSQSGWPGDPQPSKED